MSPINVLLRKKLVDEDPPLDTVLKSWEAVIATSLLRGGPETSKNFSS